MRRSDDAAYSTCRWVDTASCNGKAVWGQREGRSRSGPMAKVVRLRLRLLCHTCHTLHHGPQRKSGGVESTDQPQFISTATLLHLTPSPTHSSFLPTSSQLQSSLRLLCQLQAQVYLAAASSIPIVAHHRLRHHHLFPHPLLPPSSAVDVVTDCSTYADLRTILLCLRAVSILNLAQLPFSVSVHFILLSDDALLSLSSQPSAGCSNLSGLNARP